MSLAAFGLYACSDVSIKGLGLTMPAIQVLFLLAGGTLPWVFAQTLQTRPRPSLKPALPWLTALRVAITLGNAVLVTYTFTKLPLAQCYAIFFTMPLMITVLAWPILGEPIDPRRGFVVLVGFLGVLVALNPQATEFQFAHLTAFGGASLGAANGVLLRLIGPRENSGVMLLYPISAQFVVAALVMPFVWVPPEASTLGIAVGAGFLSAVAGFAIIAAYRLAPAIVVAPMQYSQILWASLLGILFFDEWPGEMTVAGIAMIVAAGIALLFMTKRQIQIA